MGLSLRRRITDTLATDEGLLVLDNCEHVLDAASGLVDEILRRCAGITVLVTSRERLSVEGEHLIPVAPLAVGDAASDADAAVSLFAAACWLPLRPTSRSGNTTWRPSSTSARGSTGCHSRSSWPRRAFRRCRSPKSLSGLDQRFELLTTGPRAAPRQRSLAAAIAWSYDLLDQPLQRALESLGVFAGPFPAHGALRVAEVSDIAAIVSLVERSLVQRTPDGRFVLLESLKAFATDRLEASGRLEGVRRRHAAWVLEEVVRCDGRLAADAASAFDDVDALLAEVRAAQRFMFESGDADGSLRLVVALGDYGFFRMRPEVLAWGEEAAELGRATSHPATPAALALAGLAAWKRGDLDELARLSDEAISVTEELQLPVGLHAANLAGVRGLVSGQLDDAEHWFAIVLEAPDAAAAPVQSLVTATDRALAAACTRSRPSRPTSPRRSSPASQTTPLPMAHTHGMGRPRR